MGNSRSKRQPEEGGEEGGAAAAAAAGPSVSEEEVKEGLLEFLRARVCPREDDKWEWEAVWSGEGEAAGMDSKVMPHDVKRAVALFGEVLGRKRAGEDVSADEDKLLLGLSEEPDVAFYFLRELLVIRDVPLPLPLRDETVGVARVVCISDTHSKHCSLQLPKGDFLIHAGDFSNVGKPNEVAEFLQWFGEQAFRHKVMIAGNHDLILDPAHYKTSGHRFHRGQQFHPEEVLPLLQSDRFVYLQDRHVVLDGVSIYGTPWQPEFCDWAFNVIRGSPIRPYWQQIPDQVDILISHGPALGYGDLCRGGNRAGCFDLLREINQRVKPRVHVFGHIHEAYGAFSNGRTLFVNASTCSIQYNPVQPPIVFDLPIRQPSSHPASQPASS